jgi:hypothetical protein
MRQRHAKETLASYLKAGGESEAPRAIAERACGFDIVLRLASGRIDQMHATSKFFDHPDNRQWFTRIPTRPASVRLTDLALATWKGATEARRETALVEARRLLESDIESGGVIVRLLPRQDAEKANAGCMQDGSAPAEEEPDVRTRYLKALVRDIHAEPFQPVYRRRPTGQRTTGWNERLQAYFWPAPDSGYQKTSAAMQKLTELSGQLAQALTTHGGWNESEQLLAVQLAHDVFKWGGVPQDADKVTPATVQAVYEAALRDDADAQAYMNSGWTKVATFATAHLEEMESGCPQAIWDSRVATAVISRLDRIVPHDTPIADLFPGLGTVPGRGGTRPRDLSRKWPSGYGTWRGQVAGSKIVRDIRDILNEDGYQLPQFEGGPTRWTTRDVEMVLFMDGY